MSGANRWSGLAATLFVGGVARRAEFSPIHR